MTTVFDPASVRPGILVAFERSWAEIAGPGTWWDGPARVAMVEVARAARAGGGPPATALPGAAAEAAALLAAAPARTTESWVSRVCEAMGEAAFVELLGVVARVMAIDTFHRLAGQPLAPLPEPRPGEPTREPPPDGMRRHRTWVSMVRPAPPFVLGAVPGAMRAMNELSDVLYMPGDEMGDPDWRRGELHRTQVELVAAATSHANQCFY